MTPQERQLVDDLFDRLSKLETAPRDPDAVAAQTAAGAATGRFTRPDEVADLILLLASDRAGNVTGADITIDGGLITTL